MSTDHHGLADLGKPMGGIFRGDQDRNVGRDARTTASHRGGEVQILHRSMPLAHSFSTRSAAHRHVTPIWAGKAGFGSSLRTGLWESAYAVRRGITVTRTLVTGGR